MTRTHLPPTSAPTGSVTPSRTLLHGVLALAAISTAGAAISVAGDLSPTWAEAYGSHGRLSIPWPMMLAQVVVATVSTGRRRLPVMLSSGLVAVALLLGVVSGFFDGGYADGRMDAFERTYQLLLITGLVVVGVVAVRRLVTAYRAS